MLRMFLARLVAKLKGPPLQRSPAVVIRVLEQELSGTADRGEWDELVCVPDADPKLERIRQGIPLEGATTESGRAAVEQALAALKTL